MGAGRWEPVLQLRKKRTSGFDSLSLVLVPGCWALSAGSAAKKKEPVGLMFCPRYWSLFCTYEKEGREFDFLSLVLVPGCCVLGPDSAAQKKKPVGSIFF